MSACTRRASASASALETVSTRLCCTSTLVRSSCALASMLLTLAFWPASMSAVEVSSASFTMRCSWFSSARFLRPCSMTMVCSLFLCSSSRSMSDFLWISPMWKVCSRFVLSMAFRSSVVFSRLDSSCCGRSTCVMVQFWNFTPHWSNFLFSKVRSASARFPRSMRTVWWDCARTSTRMPSSTAPERSWSKCTAPSLYTKSTGLLMLKTMCTSTPTRTLSEVGHSFTGAL
mmetsp:Transcript_106275/g.310720  ORF Transcript_106275/g.310720 Transcript_106275/m.310720 type:complete len:230 (-) Transcript_106275:350-1039(-)